MTTKRSTPPEDPAFEDPSFSSSPIKEILPGEPLFMSPKTTILPLSSRAGEWQEKVDRQVERAMLGLEDTICGVVMNRFTTARASLLRVIDNEFISGKPLSEIKDPFLSVGRFLVIMSVPLSTGRKLVMDMEKLDEAAYDLLDTIAISKVEELVSQVNAFVHRSMGGQVFGEPETENEASSGPKN